MQFKKYIYSVLPDLHSNLASHPLGRSMKCPLSPYGLPYWFAIMLYGGENPWLSL